jgi:23S rRNA maturation-related 3'-5' exoribonuclease YhaM
MSHALITHQNIGDDFSGTYYVESAYIKQTVTNKDYTDMVLRDKSGARPVKHWGTVKDLAKGCWAFVAGCVEEYQGNPSIIVRNVEIVNEPDELDDYIPVYEGCEELADQFDSIKDMIKNDETCSLLIDEIYRNGSFFDRFVRCPASDGSKYGKRGGLLASVVKLANLSLDAGKSLELSDYETSIILTSALLCQVGATDAYGFEDCMPVMTKRGLLLGTANLTMTRVSSALRRVIGSAKAEGKSVDQETIIRILHAITSSNENCGVKPMTKEAMILESMLRLQNEIVDAVDFIDSDVNDDEFTAFDPRMRRRYYRG